VHTSVRRLFLLPVILLAVLVGGCQANAAALPRLDDPQEILEEALRTTAELEFVHAKVDLDVSGPIEATASIEADINLESREFHATGEADLGIAGGQRAELLLVGTEMFTRLEGIPGLDDDTKWRRSTMGAGQDPRAGIPPNPAIAVALRALFDDPSLETELRGMESCGSRECYHVRATIAPDLLWRALNGALFGAPPDAEIPPVDPSLAPVTVDLLVDEATRRLDSVTTTVEYGGITVDVSILFTNHDVEFELVAPAADQVDDSAGGFEGLDILDLLGGGFLGGDT
jgi:hypothetical protein